MGNGIGGKDEKRDVRDEWEKDWRKGRKEGCERRMGKGLESRKKEGCERKMTKGLAGRTGKKRNCIEGWEKRLKRRTGIVNEEKNRKRDWRDEREK